jgi:hypothetical protein
MIHVGAEFGGAATVMVPACWVPVASAGTAPKEPASVGVELEVELELGLELGALVLLPLLLLVQAAIPTASSAAAPATPTRATCADILLGTSIALLG